MDGNGIAAYKVGCYLFKSEYEGEIKDGQAQAVKWFRMGVENSNSAPCLYKLACCYAFAFGVEQDPDIAAELFDRAFPLLKQQAEAKDSLSQHLMGCYYLVYGCNLSEAIYWLRESVKQGNDEAVGDLESALIMDYEGKLTENSSFINELIVRAEQGDALIQEYLGGLYRTMGNTLSDALVPPDNDQAFYWYKKAAENGRKYAKYALSKYFKNYV